MEQAGVIAVVVLAVAVVGGIAYYAWLQEKKRTEFLSALALSLGLRFTGHDYSIDNRYHSLLGFNQGHSRYGYNILRGRYREREIEAFDYRYTVTTYHTDSKGRRHRRDTNYYSSSVILEIPAAFPELFIRQEGVLDKLGAAIGFDDIDFESAEFSRKFYVKSASRRFAYDVIHARAMEFLLGRAGWQMQLKGRYLQLYKQGRFKHEDFQRVMDDAVEFMDMVPGFVYDNLSGGVY